MSTVWGNLYYMCAFDARQTLASISEGFSMKTHAHPGWKCRTAAARTQTRAFHLRQSSVRTPSGPILIDVRALNARIWNKMPLLMTETGYFSKLKRAWELGFSNYVLFPCANSIFPKFPHYWSRGRPVKQVSECQGFKMVDDSALKTQEPKFGLTISKDFLGGPFLNTSKKFLGARFRYLNSWVLFSSFEVAATTPVFLWIFHWRKQCERCQATYIERPSVAWKMI